LHVLTISEIAYLDAIGGVMRGPAIRRGFGEFRRFIEIG
jgi:hypothetical protein